MPHYNENELFKAGVDVKKSILSAEFVEFSLDNATEFTREMQQITTEYCWGTIWTRPGLELKQRSLINIGILTALAKPNELKHHVKGALRNGCTTDEIKEVLLQCIIYCGLPAAVDAFKLTQEAIAEYEKNNTDILDDNE